MIKLEINLKNLITNYQFGKTKNVNHPRLKAGVFVEDKNLEGLKSFAENYDKHKKQIDYLCEQINDGLMSLGDLDHYGNIGIWTRIKVRNLGL
jgi:hypothetical protein